MRQIITVIISVVVSIVLVMLVLRDVPVAEVTEAISRANLLWVVASIIVTIIALLFRAERWRGLLDFRLSLWDSIWIIGITFTMNLLPFRAGEIARSLLATQRDIPVFTAATSILVERLLDTLLVVIVVALVIAQLPEASAQVTNSALLFGGAAVTGFLVLLFFAHQPQIARNLLAWFNKRIPVLERLPLENLLNQVLEGLQSLTRWQTLLHAVVWTIISWISSFMILYCAIRALDIQVAQVQYSLLGVSLASLSIAIPLTVAGVGLIEGAIKVAGNLLSVPDIASTALGFLFHGIIVLGYLLVGLPGIAIMGVSVSDILQRSSKDDAPEQTG